MWPILGVTKQVTYVVSPDECRIEAVFNHELMGSKTEPLKMSAICSKQKLPCSLSVRIWKRISSRSTV